MSLGGKAKRFTAAQLSNLRARFDSWSNALTGLNTGRDKTTSTLPYEMGLLSQQTLESLYHNDDLANRIVSAVPDEAFREPWTVINHTVDVTDDESIQEQASDLSFQLEEFGAREKLREAMTWGRLYGLGAVYVGINDGKETWEEVDWNNIQEITCLTVLDKRDLTPWRWYADPFEDKFGDVAIYLMQPVGVFVGAPYDLQSTNATALVHESRMLRFGGELTAKRRRLANQGSDYSILQRCFRALQLTNDNWQSAAALLADASQGVLTISGLIDMIDQQPEVMQSRFQFMDMARSTVRAIVLDGGDGSRPPEKFERVSSHFEGLPPMLQETWKRLAAAARMPLTVLMGVSPGGLNATGESDLHLWYDQVAAAQEQEVRPNIERLLKLFATAANTGNEEDWSVIFAPLWQMTDIEQATMHFQQAQSDVAYITNGVLQPEEVALNRFGGIKYSLDTQIDSEPRKKILELAHETSEVQAGNELDAAKNPPDPNQPGVVGPGAPSKKAARPKSSTGRPPGNPEN